MGMLYIDLLGLGCRVKRVLGRAVLSLVRLGCLRVVGCVALPAEGDLLVLRRADAQLLMQF